MNYYSNIDSSLVVFFRASFVFPLLLPPSRSLTRRLSQAATASVGGGGDPRFAKYVKMKAMRLPGAVLT